MQDNVVKQFIKRLCFLPGAVRRICFGPLRGMVFGVSDIVSSRRPSDTVDRHGLA